MDHLHSGVTFNAESFFTTLLFVLNVVERFEKIPLPRRTLIHLINEHISTSVKTGTLHCKLMIYSYNDENDSNGFFLHFISSFLIWKIIALNWTSNKPFQIIECNYATWAIFSPWKKMRISEYKIWKKVKQSVHLLTQPSIRILLFMLLIKPDADLGKPKNSIQLVFADKNIHFRSHRDQKLLILWVQMFKSAFSLRMQYILQLL